MPMTAKKLISKYLFCSGKSDEERINDVKQFDRKDLEDVCLYEFDHEQTIIFIEKVKKQIKEYWYEDTGRTIEAYFWLLYFSHVLDIELKVTWENEEIAKFFFDVLVDSGFTRTGEILKLIRNLDIRRY